MTIGEALERAEQLRPNCRIETETRLQWLREADALLRTKLFDRTAAGAFDAVGADRPWEQPVQDDQTLLHRRPLMPCTRTCCVRRWMPLWARPTATPGSRRSTMPCTQSWRSGCGRTTRPAAGRSGAGKEVR